MRGSVFALLAVAALTSVGASACSQTTPPSQKPGAVGYAAQTATLDITNGIQVLGVVAMPSDTTLETGHAPLWLQGGSEVAVAARLSDGRGAVLGFSGPQLGNRRVIAQDFGTGAPDGRILDIVASPDGLEIATAVAEPTKHRLEVIIREALSVGGGHPVSSIDGTFEFAELTWLDRSRLALVAGAPHNTELAVGIEAGAKVPDRHLQIINVSGQPSTRVLDNIRCPLSRLSFSPDANFAVGEGDAFSVSAIFDLRDGSCWELGFRGDIRTLGWAFDSRSFLYEKYGRRGMVPSIFRYDLPTGQSRLIAISSSAAAYASDGTIIALGSRQLPRSGITAAPGAKIKAEVALFDPHQAEIRINSLGFETTPLMMAESRLIFSTASDNAVIDIAIPGVGGPLRELIEYSYRAEAAFVLATGAAQVPLAMSWSPDGHLLAVVDGSLRASTLTVIAPPK